MSVIIGLNKKLKKLANLIFSHLVTFCSRGFIEAFKDHDGSLSKNE